MDLWQGRLPDFVTGTRRNELAGVMAHRYEAAYGRQPADAEYSSWEQSLAAVAEVASSGRSDDLGVLVEYHLPLTERRIDVMFFGRQVDGTPGSLLVELKRWQAASLENKWAQNVLIGEFEHVHPSEQALDYAEYLEDSHKFYADTDHDIQPCAYCHEMSEASGSPLRDSRFERLLEQSPLFLRGGEDDLVTLLNQRVGHGDGMALMDEVSSGAFRPGKRIVESLNAVLEQDEEWHLLDEQRKAFNTIWAEMQRLKEKGRSGAEADRSAILVRGGPGTGKSVIAVQLLAAALKNGLAAVHSTGGKAFTTVMRGTFRRARPVFVWNRSLRTAPPLGLDLLLTDEAHRIRKTSDFRWTPRAERNRRSQIDELLDAARVSVFFLDEHQFMRPDEIGDSRLVRDATAKRGIPLREYDLSAQFRCGGAREYVEWVDYLLGFRPEPPESFARRYEFDVAAGPGDLDAMLDQDESQTSRLVAGFCWKWSDVNDDGSLAQDVVIQDWTRPWNRKEDRRKSYRPENHPYTIWATTPEGVGQVGCIYSAQGFEFERVGVIWGRDLVWRNGAWVGNKSESRDGGLRGANPEEAPRLIRHAYRVLLTRGIRGTRVLCLDEETRNHIEERLRQVVSGRPARG